MSSVNMPYLPTRSMVRSFSSVLTARNSEGGFVRKVAFCLCLAVFLMAGPMLQATIFGRVQGIVHDPQHQPMAGASVKLQAITSDLYSNHANGRER